MIQNIAGGIIIIAQLDKTLQKQGSKITQKNQKVVDRPTRMFKFLSNGVYSAGTVQLVIIRYCLSSSIVFSFHTSRLALA